MNKPWLSLTYNSWEEEDEPWGKRDGENIMVVWELKESNVSSFVEFSNKSHKQEVK